VKDQIINLMKENQNSILHYQSKFKKGCKCLLYYSDILGISSPKVILTSIKFRCKLPIYTVQIHHMPSHNITELWLWSKKHDSKRFQCKLRASVLQGDININKIQMQITHLHKFIFIICPLK